MKHTLIMRLAGPMQSWGIDSRFSIRDTLSEPSKSGVIGILCAALGWDRQWETMEIAGKRRTLIELDMMRYGIRVLQEGSRRRDYHTALEVLRSNAKIKAKGKRSQSEVGTVVSERHYLSDAHFLVGLESSERPLLEALDVALHHPHWPLALGRKSFIPSSPVRFSLDQNQNILNAGLVEALLDVNDPQFIHQKVSGDGQESADNRFILDLGADTSALSSSHEQISQVQRTDVPLSFSERRFAPREVLTYMPKSHVHL